MAEKLEGEVEREGLAAAAETANDVLLQGVIQNVLSDSPVLKGLPFVAFVPGKQKVAPIEWSRVSGAVREAYRGLPPREQIVVLIMLGSAVLPKRRLSEAGWRVFRDISADLGRPGSGIAMRGGAVVCSPGP